jgi:hypothetical protein
LALPLGLLFVYYKPVQRSTPKREKAGRPATGHDPVVAVRIPTEMREAAEQIARDRKTSLSDIIREALREFIDKLRRR